jgi:hypothetical protein
MSFPPIIIRLTKNVQRWTNSSEKISRDSHFVIAVLAMTRLMEDLEVRNSVITKLACYLVESLQQAVARSMHPRTWSHVH